jgi:hypothetical protein
MVCSFIFSLFKTKIMKKINYGFAAILFMLGVACRKVPDVSCNSPTNDADLSRELIIGDWKWIRTHFLQSNVITTPKNALYQVELRFKEDGIVQIYKDGRFVDTSSYEIAIEKKYTSFYGDTLRNVLAIRPTKNFQITPVLERFVPIRICTDSLYLLYDSYGFHTGDNYFSRK